MANLYGPKIVTSGLVLCLDAGSSKSYPGTGTVWTDLSGNGNNGTLTNGPTYSAANRGSIAFDGTNDYVSLSDSNFPSGTNPRTVQIWIKTPSTISGNNFSYFSYGTASGGQMFILGITASYPYADTNRFFYSNYGGAFWCSTNIVANTFYNVALSYDSSNHRFYLNGIIDSPATFLSNSIVLDTYSYIGARRDGIGGTDASEHFACNIFSCFVYNRTLSANEILQNYNATKGRFNL